MSVETDSHGRLYLSSELREKYGEKFHVVRYQDRIELIPIDEEPLAAAREAAGDTFKGQSISEIKEEALAKTKAEAEVEAEERERMRREYEGE